RAEREILEEVPEEAPPFALAGRPEIPRHPESLVENGCGRAVSRHDQARHPIGDAGYDAERHDHFDCESAHEHGNCERAWLEYLLRLFHRTFEPDNLVERAERQEEDDEEAAHDQRHDRGGAHFSRSAIRSATRSALAMIVSVGLTAPIAG